MKAIMTIILFVYSINHIINGKNYLDAYGIDAKVNWKDWMIPVLYGCLPWVCGSFGVILIAPILIYYMLQTFIREECFDELRINLWPMVLSVVPIYFMSVEAYSFSGGVSLALNILLLLALWIIVIYSIICIKGKCCLDLSEMPTLLKYVGFILANIICSYVFFISLGLYMVKYNCL